MWTDQDYQQRYTILREISITLDPDPVAVGLVSLTAKLAEVQRLRNRVAAAFAEAIRNKSEAEIARTTAKHIRDTDFTKAVATDSEVRSQSSDKSREAMAQTKITTQLLNLHFSEVEFIKAAAYCTYIEKLHDVLEAANNNLSRQISVIQMSINIGEVDPGSLRGVKSSS